MKVFHDYLPFSHVKSLEHIKEICQAKVENLQRPEYIGIRLYFGPEVVIHKLTQILLTPNGIDMFLLGNTYLETSEKETVYNLVYDVRQNEIKFPLDVDEQQYRRLLDFMFKAINLIDCIPDEIMRNSVVKTFLTAYTPYIFPTYHRYVLDDQCIIHQKAALKTLETYASLSVV